MIEARQTRVAPLKGSKGDPERKGMLPKGEESPVFFSPGRRENILSTVAFYAESCLAKHILLYMSSHDRSWLDFFKGSQKEKEKMRRIIALLVALVMVLGLTACGGNNGGQQEAAIPGLEDGVLTVAMECAYAPYNWAQEDDSNGAVPIKDSPLYANGYDVMMAKAICEANGWQLEIVQTDWDSLIPGVQSGLYDATIAGQSMTSERMEVVDFAGPYLYATIVCLARNDSQFANAHGLADLAGGSCTSQSGTIWYETCLPQIANANILNPTESAPAMLMAVASDPNIFVCTDRPTAQGALLAYPELVLLDFAGSGDDFEVSDEEVNIGIAVQKGNTALVEAINAYLATLTVDDFNALMDTAISVQPLDE